MKVIVGVTTTKARLGIFFYSFQSLKRQSFEDFRIAISLSKEPYLFDEGIDAIPEWMKGGNVQVDFVANSGPYRKLLPQIARINDEDIVVTADDDVIYSDDWLKRLVGKATEKPEFIVCCGARKIRRNLLGGFQNYSNWELCSEIETGADLLPTCGSGAVFRKNLLDLEFLSDEAYLEYAPTNDDLWFRLASMRKGVEVYVDPRIDRENGYIRHYKGLQEINLHWAKGGQSMYKRMAVKIRNKVRNYLGIPLSRNDLAWRRSWEYATARASVVRSNR
jgi:hypothetical protein